MVQDSQEAQRLQGEVRRAKNQCELVKKLLADAIAENEIQYEVGGGGSGSRYPLTG